MTNVGATETVVVAPSKRRRWRNLIVIVVPSVIVAAAGVVVWSISLRYAHARALHCVCGIGWVDAQDGRSEVQSQADGHIQMTVKLRPNAHQGFYVWIANDSQVTQTVLGLPAGYQRPYGGHDYKLELSTAGLAGAGKDWEHLSYAPEGQLVPGADRVLRLTWVSPSCLDRDAYIGTDALQVRVRVGAFTRTESISLSQEMALTGTQHCPIS